MMVTQNGRRSRHKISQMPPEVVERVNKELSKGTTYEKVVEMLEECGYTISTTSVHRYSKEFLVKLERLKIAKEQAKVLVEEVSDRPATEMHEAANQMAVQLITELLMNGNFEDEGAIQKLSGIFKSLAALEKSAVLREKLKADRADDVAAAITSIKKELADELQKEPDLLRRMTELVERVESKHV